VLEVAVADALGPPLTLLALSPVVVDEHAARAAKPDTVARRTRLRIRHSSSSSYAAPSTSDASLDAPIGARSELQCRMRERTRPAFGAHRATNDTRTHGSCMHRREGAITRLQR